MNNIKEYFGDIDIYLFDQLQKGTFDQCKNVLDVGCGTGRNLIYFLKNGFEVFGIDPNPEAVRRTQELAQKLNPKNSSDNFIVTTAENLPFKEDTFDLVLCSAVLHFANDEKHFDQMIHSMWKVLKPGGFLFTRLASSIGIENLIKDAGNGRYYLPDGSVRFLVTEKMLLEYTSSLDGELFEYIKTTNVQNLRCMTTWCLRKK